MDGTLNIQIDIVKDAVAAIHMVQSPPPGETSAVSGVFGPMPEVELKPAPTEPQGLEAKLVPPPLPDGIGTRIVAAPNEAPREHWSAEMNLAYSTGFAAALYEIAQQKGLNVEQVRGRLVQMGFNDGRYEGVKRVLQLLQIEYGPDEPEGIPAKLEARLEQARGRGYQKGYAAAVADGKAPAPTFSEMRLAQEAHIREAKFEAFQHGRQVEREEAEKAAAKPDAVGAGDYDMGVQAGWDTAINALRHAGINGPPDMAAAVAHIKECVIDEVLGGLGFDTRDLTVAPVELARRLGEADRYAQGVCDGQDYALAELGWPEMTIEDAKDAKSKRGQEILEDGKRAGQNLALAELGFKAGDLAGAVAAVQSLKDRRAGIGRDDIIDEVLAALGFGGMTIEEAQICRRHEQEEANEVVQAAAQALDPEGPYAAGMKHVLTALGWGNLELGDAVSAKSKLTIDAAFAHNKPLPSDDHAVRFRDGEAAGVRAALLRLGFTGMTLDDAAQAAQELRARDPGSDPILSRLPADRPLLQILVELGATAQLGTLEGHHGRIDRANAIREAVMATEVVWRRDVAANRDMGAASNYGADKQQEVTANA